MKVCYLKQRRSTCVDATMHASIDVDRILQTSEVPSLFIATERMRMVATLQQEQRKSFSLQVESLESMAAVFRETGRIERSYRLVRPRGVGFAVDDLSRSYLARLIDFPEILLRSTSGQWIKQGRTAQLLKAEIPLRGSMQPVAYKRVRRRNWLKAASALLRVNGTLRSWKLGHRLLSRGINTARPLAVIVPHRHSAGRESYLLTEWIEGGSNLHEFCRQVSARHEAIGRRLMRSAAERMGELIGRLHCHAFSHRDLKFGNLLIAERSGQIEAYVIDLDGAESRKQLTRRLRLRNVARLAVDARCYRSITRSQRLRFLRSYLAACGEMDGDWKRDWRELEALTDARMRRKRKNVTFADS